MSLLAQHPGPTTPQLALRCAQIRQRSVALAKPLSEADCQVQSMSETSPVKWHLAHTSWFFETFVLQPLEPDFKPFNPAFRAAMAPTETRAGGPPLYWRRNGMSPNPSPNDWHSFTLHGLVPLDACTPIAHISWFEADAFARWWSAQHPQVPATRLPTEFEWEQAAQTLGANAIASGNFVETGALHPMPVSSAQGGLLQMLGDVWEWTASSYLPYPGFKAGSGRVGEYNAKFMVNQMVLRGGSCATPRSHIRASYRNFFPTDAPWQFNGLRLARDLP